MNLVTFSMTRASAGYLNSLWLVQRNDTDVEDKIVIRFYGGNSSSPWDKNQLLDHGFGRELESTVARAASDVAIGPRVYTATDTFRIEKFIESRNFKWTDYEDDFILSEFARNLARFHSMIQRDEFAPFRETKVDLFAHGDNIFTRFADKWPRVVQTARDQYHYTGGVDDLFQEFHQMKKLSKRLKLKNVLINWDLNTMNILIRKELDQPGQLKTVLIDYEFAHYNMRSFDIGITACRSVMGSAVSGHKLVFTDEEILAGLQRFEDVFLKSYHEEWTKCCRHGEEDQHADSWHDLLVESYFGACFTWISSTAMLMLFMFPLIPEEEKVIHSLARKLSASFHFQKLAKSRLFHLCPQLSDS